MSEAVTRVVRPAAGEFRVPGFVTKWMPVRAAVLPSSEFERASLSPSHIDELSAGPGALTDGRGNRPIVMVASLETEDRAGDLVLASGWDLCAYEANPVVLWAHDYSRPAIGRSLSTKIERGSLVAHVEFAPTEFAQEVRSLYLSGFMRGVSVGFRALETAPRTASSGRPATLFRRQELLEISAAPVPLNPHALAQGGSAALREAQATALRSRPGAVSEATRGNGIETAESSEQRETVSALREIAGIWREIARTDAGI